MGCLAQLAKGSKVANDRIPHLSHLLALVVSQKVSVGLKPPLLPSTVAGHLVQVAGNVSRLVGHGVMMLGTGGEVERKVGGLK